MRDSFLVPLHVNILTLFLLVSFTLAALLAWYNYEENSKAAVDSAEQFLIEVNEKIYERIAANYDQIYSLAGTISELPDMNRKPGMLLHPMARNAMRALKEAPGIHSVYLGFSDGDFYQIVSFWDNIEAKRKAYGAPAGAKYAVRRLFTRDDGVRVEVYKYLDGDKQILASTANREPDYDPTVRPWFRQAMATYGQIRTDLYIYSYLQVPGFTVASRFDGPVPGVLGVDVTLDNLCRFLSRQRIGDKGQVLIFNSFGQLLAYSDPAKVIQHEPQGPGMSGVVPANIFDLGDPALTAVYGAFKKQGIQAGRVSAEGRDYLWRVTPINDRNGKKEYIAVIAPVRDFTGPIERTRSRSLVFTIAAFLLIVPLSVYFSRRVSRPLRKLVHEAEAIRRLEFEEPLDVRSRVKEIHDLTQAMASMKTAVQTFGRYVPKALVGSILNAQVLPILGGERRELTILFTDVADFTTLAENLRAEELMHKVSLYFREIGAVIAENKGTIDKYIGDAIMAFWNAPEEDEDHVLHACEAVLEARAVSEHLNRAWESEGKEPLTTRFGLHTSDGVVGNIGSYDRMNYTAIGKAVNTASRLEGLNKHYGTQILVSEDIERRARDLYLMRPIDLVVPKGSAEAVQVFELIGALPSNAEAKPGARVSEEDVVLCRDWIEAYRLYRGRRFREAAESFAAYAAMRPKDQPARLYQARAEAYAANPPQNGWTGVEEFKTK